MGNFDRSAGHEFGSYLDLVDTPKGVRTFDNTAVILRVLYMRVWNCCHQEPCYSKDYLALLRPCLLLTPVA